MNRSRKRHLKKMSSPIRLPKNYAYEDIVQEVLKTDPFSNHTEGCLIGKILTESTDEEKALEFCRKVLGLKLKGMELENLEEMRRQVDEVISALSKSTKEEFKKNVKESCGIEVFQNAVSTHIPIAPEEEVVTALHQDAERMLEYLDKRNQFGKLLPGTVGSLKEIVDNKGVHSDRANRRRTLSTRMAELIHGLHEIKFAISPIEKALKSFDKKSKETYAKVIYSHFSSLKKSALSLVGDVKLFEKELKECIKEGQKYLESTPDYIDEDCNICVEMEKKWDDRWSSRGLLEPLTPKDARDLHTRLVRSGGMRGIIEQFKNLLACENANPEMALPMLACSMTDPTRASSVYNLISEHNFLKGFKENVLLKTKDDKFPKVTVTDCSICGIPVSKCSF